MTIFDQLGVPPELIDRMEYTPVEVLLKRVLEPEFASAGVKVHTTIPEKPSLPFVLIRRLSGMGFWSGDPRGLYDKARVAIHCYTANPNGELKGYVLGEIIRTTLRKAVSESWSDPELGSLTNVRMTSEPTRMSDWATSSGPVQYADLPNGGWRYEAHYSVTVRPPNQ